MHHRCDYGPFNCLLLLELTYGYPYWNLPVCIMAAAVVSRVEDKQLYVIMASNCLPLLELANVLCAGTVAEEGS